LIRIKRSCLASAEARNPNHQASLMYINLQRHDRQ
jgi:hypothetical protein